VKKSKGCLGEEIARVYLEEQGLITKAQNFHTEYGEIDLIMQDQDVLVFVEVKYRSTDRYGNPLEAVNWHKQRKIKQMAQRYIAQLGYEPVCRFDVLGILETEIYWVKGAFS
jgi:putative endonuclease